VFDEYGDIGVIGRGPEGLYFNFAERIIHFRIEIGFGADYHDLFEVRGTSRPRRGTCTARGDQKQC
jgi:N-terminal domain of (some) glycogen debranching enzymes